MTKRVTVSLPDDVAADLERLPDRQVSGYVVEALRRRQAGDRMRTLLSDAGHCDHPVDIVVSRQRLDAHRVDPALGDAVRRRLAAEGLFPAEVE